MAGRDGSDLVRRQAVPGSGTIIQSCSKISRVTTGDGMWMAGAIGLACGGGLFAIAIVLTLAMFVVMTLLGLLENYFERRLKNSSGSDLLQR